MCLFLHVLVCARESSYNEIFLTFHFLHFRSCLHEDLMVPTGANAEAVCPTHGMQTQYRARARGFTFPPAVPLAPISPFRSPITNINRTQSPQKKVSNAEFHQSMHMFAQLVASQFYQSVNVGFVTSSSEVTRVGQFMRMNPPSFTGSKI